MTQEDHLKLAAHYSAEAEELAKKADHSDHRVRAASCIDTSLEEMTGEPQDRCQQRT